MKYYLIAGEASGDLHAANLMRELKVVDANAEFRFWGGDKMQAQGGELIKHYKDLAFMGFAEVVMNLRTILRNISFCKKDILAYQPDVVILIDYPGFNLRIAKFLKKQGIKVFYYISPQIWAWKEGRVHGIKKTVDKMYVILPFEAAFYKKWNYPVDFVGHPLLDALAQRQPDGQFLKRNGLSNKPLIGLLPGSRKQEIKRMLPILLSVVHRFPEYDFVVAGLSQIEPEFYEQAAKGQPYKLVTDQTYALLEHSQAALVTSGTATLETALLNIPQVVCYKGGTLSYLIAKQVIKVPYIALVNLIMDRKVVEELIQNDLTEARLETTLKELLQPAKRNQMQQDYEMLREKLGGPGASARAAQLMWAELNKV
jgi:lipid-A-disaccharide synthase